MINFPIGEFSFISIQPMVDTRFNDPRYYMNVARGNKSPYYVMSLTTSKLPYDEYMALTAVIEASEGILETFTIAHPLPALATFSDQNVHANFNAGSKEVLITGNREFKVGDYIQFSTHTKVYRIASVLRQTNTTIGLTCPLVEDILSSSTMKYGENVEWKFRLNSEFSTDIAARESKFGIIDVELIEQA